MIYKWRSDVHSFPELDGQTSSASGPMYVYEYNTRATYGTDVSGWGLNDPLNATWWHLVTERKTRLRRADSQLLATSVFRERWKRTRLVTVHPFLFCVILRRIS
jgi:sphingomyelin phosphodiesterase